MLQTVMKSSCITNCCACFYPTSLCVDSISTNTFSKTESLLLCLKRSKTWIVSFYWSIASSSRSFSESIFSIELLFKICLSFSTKSFGFRSYFIYANASFRRVMSVYLQRSSWKVITSVWQMPVL